MAELLPSTEELGSGGLLLDHSSPRDPITSYDPDVEIHHTEFAQNAPDRKIDSPAAVVVVEEEGTATEEEVGLLDALERDLYRLTIEQAEIETGRETERLGAVNEDKRKDVGNIVLDVVHEEKGVNTEALSVGHESQNGLSYSEKNEGAEELENVRSYVEKEGTLKFDNLHEEKDQKIEVSGEDENVNLLPYVENEEAMKLDNLHEVKGEKIMESVEDENVKDRWCYMDHMGVNEENQGAVTRFGRSNQNNYSKGINYPVRPDADDCTFYVRHGACKFGVNCKFNHPPKRKYQGAKERTYPTEENSERAGQTQCKYYLTSAGCKYGKDCKYSHGSDKISMSHHNLEFNFLGLPIRPEEKECSYYMRTGTCKYGSNCRFHHPEPTTVVDSDSPSGYGNGGSVPSQHVSSSSWSPPRAFQEASSFTPFEAATYPTSERSLPTPPAFSLANMPTEMNFPMQHRHGMVVQEYPERMGEPECVFFMKTGDCKYKSNCKFHHPKNHIAKARGNQFTLNDKGLPLRPDQPICTHFHRYGICKYGPACKYDHPSGYGNSPMPYDHQPAF